MNTGLYAYLGAAIAYGSFATMLLFSWRASLQGKLLTVVMFISAIWSVVAAAMAAESGFAQVETYKILEILRYVAWFIFLLKLFDAATPVREGRRKFVRWVLPFTVGFACLILLDELSGVSGQPLLALIGHILLALIGLAIIEQLYRNTSERHRPAIKYLILAIGALFAFDFALYSDTLLFRSVDQTLWDVRGVVHVVAVPLLALASVRNKNWSLNVFVSRDIVLSTTAILFGGLYLVFIASAGYYLREFGGNWGQIIQVAFIALAIVLLFAVLFSRQLRSQARVFLGKHFYRNKYDYRVEWLRLTDKLSGDFERDERYIAAIEAMANTIEARAGMLWLQNDQSVYTNVASWNAPRVDKKIEKDDSLIQFFEDKGFIINITEIASHPDEYSGLRLPRWVPALKRPWLMVPLFGSTSVIGFVVLANPLVTRSINWEDRDFLSSAAKQVTSYLMVILTSDALAQAKQFEVFTRLSAYMVHDLKNIAAGLELISSNAKKHSNNPSFIKDAFETVDSAAADIKRLLEQLRNRHVETEKRIKVDVNEVLTKVIESKQQCLPLPVIKETSMSCYANVEKGRLANVLAHLIDNAQQATNDNGTIEVKLISRGSTIVIEIKDSGIGMDADFIRKRLFKPFDTTKGNAGMGIGMYESREFIRRLGGEVLVNSEPGKGTTISLHIPADQPDHYAVANAS
jgi:putative PEP-CTERM system histidine kinase